MGFPFHSEKKNKQKTKTNKQTNKQKNPLDPELFLLERTAGTKMEKSLRKKGFSDRTKSGSSSKRGPKK